MAVLSQSQRAEKLRLQIAGYIDSPHVQAEIKRKNTIAARQRFIEEAEQRRRQREQRQRDSEISRQLQAERSARARLEAGIVQAQRQQQRRAALDNEMRRRQSIVAALDRAINPPPEAEPEIVYVPEGEWGSPNLGRPDFNPLLFAEPMRWR